MASLEKRTVALPAEQAGYIDATVESWLQEDVAPAFDAMQRDPSRAIPATQVFAAIRARHEALMPG